MGCGEKVWPQELVVNQARKLQILNSTPKSCRRTVGVLITIQNLKHTLKAPCKLPFRSLAQAVNGPEASSDQEEHDPIGS